MANTYECAVCKAGVVGADDFRAHLHAHAKPLHGKVVRFKDDRDRLACVVGARVATNPQCIDLELSPLEDGDPATDYLYNPLVTLASAEFAAVEEQVAASRRLAVRILKAAERASAIRPGGAYDYTTYGGDVVAVRVLSPPAWQGGQHWQVDVEDESGDRDTVDVGCLSLAKLRADAGPTR